MARHSDQYVDGVEVQATTVSGNSSTGDVSEDELSDFVHRSAPVAAD